MSITRINYSNIKGSSNRLPCRVATTTNITLSGLQTIDGVTLSTDDRVLVRVRYNYNAFLFFSLVSFLLANDCSLVNIKEFFGFGFSSL